VAGGVREGACPGHLFYYNQIPPSVCARAGCSYAFLQGGLSGVLATAANSGSLAMLAAMRRASSLESDVPTFTRLRVFCAWASSSAAG
jgi:hypothetical protein